MKTMKNKQLVSAEASRALDAEAQAEWGFNVFSLIEAAGRSCAVLFTETFPDYFKNQPKITVCAGTGNNAADAMIMLRYWILCGLAEVSSCALLLCRLPKNGETGPWVEIFGSLKKMKVPYFVLNGDKAGASDFSPDDILAASDIIVDGIAGTGINGPLRGNALEMLNAINLCKNKLSPIIVSVDVPSGNFDGWEGGIPMVEADITLAIEPRKYCIYSPLARPYAGNILAVEGIFPQELIAGCKGAELLEWEKEREKIPKIRGDAYKNRRGTVEIRAGSAGTTGAALIAARGAQAAGAGLIRLAADDDIYPVLASQVSGIMVIPAYAENNSGGMTERDAILLGPGWGKTPERMRVLEKAALAEKTGVPLILDADAIELARDMVFSGNAILTPHPGEFCKFAGVKKDELLNRPVPLLLKYAQERKALILLKGHVITIAAPDGRVGVVDGMAPVLAAGGSGDLLAGFCAAIAARMAQEERFDAYTCAAAAAALLIASARAENIKNRFTDPMELADTAASLAGGAWLAF
ncbi:MAG: NAD(P)H-hydrate dehydratase [Treponema sp.]|nr:NAD(P)H-hydrate dehydratase [Treponema sp.]